MNKIVINGDYGGFGLSDKAIEWMIDNGLEEDYYEVNPDYRPESIWQNHYYLNSLLPRHHPLLIQAVEKFGEEANGSAADLKVVEIEGNVYRIDEYDGWEDVETPDTIEWITI